jgi:integrase
MPKKRIEFLTLDELTSIEDSDFKIERLSNIRDIFIFCCYTGLAYAEVEKLTSEDITRGIDGDLWISVMRKKTKKHYDIPLLPKSMQIIKKYSNHPQCIKKGRLLPVPSNAKYNGYLKEIADIAGIKKNLTSHIARKTFASTIMLGNGVNIAVLSKLLGHASVQVTLDAYASVADELMMKNVKDLKDKLRLADDHLNNEYNY